MKLVKYLVRMALVAALFSGCAARPLYDISKLGALAGATNFYGATSRTGGAAGSLDSIDGTNLATGDGAYVIESTVFRIYYLNATSGAAESDDTIISPNTNAGNKRWELIFRGDLILGDVASLTPTDSNFIVGNGSTWVAESGDTARTSLGLGSGDSPGFAGLTLTKTFTPFQGADVASANDMTLGDGNFFDITGVTTINTIATKGVGTFVVLQFDGILQLTHSADLVLPTGANVTTAAGDIAVFYEYATGDWRCMAYTRADGTPVASLTPTDSNFIVGNGSTWVAESGDTARTSLGLGSGDSPGFAGLTLTKTFTPFQGADVASANDMTLGDGNFFDITGVTTINTIATKGVGTFVVLQFDGILQLTHSADLVLPTAANITTAAGDIAVFYEYAAGDWRCVVYTRADGTALAGADETFIKAAILGTL